MFWIMHFTLDQRVFENRVLPVHCYSLVMVSFLLKLYFFLTSDVISYQRMLFWWIGKQNTSDEMYCIINLFTPQLHIKIPRIKEMITNYRHSWLLGKLSLSAFRGMFRDQYREYAYTNVSLWRFKKHKRTKELENSENHKLMRHCSIVTCPVSSAPRRSLKMLSK